MNGSGSHNQPGLLPDAQANATGEVVVGIAKRDSTDPPSPYLSGEVIADRYRLERELGRGGMGVVWVAHALSLEVDVAVKLIHARIAGKAVAARMAREAHAAASLGHSALVRVFDFGWTNRADPFLVMELVHGETLSAVLSREPFIDAIRAVQMVLPIVDGLRLAHQHAIIHRDIKPENILISTNALGRIQPKLLDFGIAKVGLEDSEMKLTQVGVALGSPEYMSPEQARGIEDIDERTDVWSLAVVLYEMTTGNVPFEHENYNALLQAIIHDPPAPVPIDSALEPGLWEIVERGLHKDRDVRWRSMEEFGRALALWLYEQGVREDISGNSIRAMWIDGPTSGVRNEPVIGPSDLVPPLSKRVSAARSWANAPTTEAVAQKHRDEVRNQYKRSSLIMIAGAVASGLTLLWLATAKLSGQYDSREPNLAAPLSRMGNGMSRTVAVELVKAGRTLLATFQGATLLSTQPSSLPPTGVGSAKAGPGSRASRGESASAKLPKRPRQGPRDFGF